MILDDIVAVKRREVPERKKAVPSPVLEKNIGGMPPTRDFRKALSGGNCSIIAEVKRRSPSRGVIREDFDPVRIAVAYEQNGAAAVSVLTDNTFFGGSSEDLTAVKGAISLPVLRKEFIIDPWQIVETRAIGADALLLIAAILGEDELRKYRGLAASLGLASLVEVHDRPELEKALSSGAEIIGINNRDLRSFATDVTTSLALAPLVPADRIVVSESGIRSRAEIETLMRAGVRGFLIGETLVAAQDIGATLRGLLERLPRSRSAGSPASKMPSAQPNAGRTPSVSSSTRRAPGTSPPSGPGRSSHSFPGRSRRSASSSTGRQRRCN